MSSNWKKNIPISVVCVRDFVHIMIQFNVHIKGSRQYNKQKISKEGFPSHLPAEYHTNFQRTTQKIVKRMGGWLVFIYTMRPLLKSRYVFVVCARNHIEWWDDAVRETLLQRRIPIMRCPMSDLVLLYEVDSKITLSSEEWSVSIR